MIWERIGQVESLGAVNKLLVREVPDGASRIKVQSVTLRSGTIRYDVYSSRFDKKKEMKYTVISV